MSEQIQPNIPKKIEWLTLPLPQKKIGVFFRIDSIHDFVLLQSFSTREEALKFIDASKSASSVIFDTLKRKTLGLIQENSSSH